MAGACPFVTCLECNRMPKNEVLTHNLGCGLETARVERWSRVCVDTRLGGKVRGPWSRLGGFMLKRVIGVMLVPALLLGQSAGSADNQAEMVKQIAAMKAEIENFQQRLKELEAKVAPSAPAAKTEPDV